MKKKILAFTMIELLVVVSIISIISITSINWFFNFLQNKDLKMKILEITNYIWELDKKIKNNEIYDYKIDIKSWINDWYIVYENIYDNDNFVNLSYSYGSWSLNISWLWWGVWKLLIYKWNKLDKNENIFLNSYNYVNIDSNYDYKFLSFLSWSTDLVELNTIYIKKLNDENSNLWLTKISNTVWWTDIWNLEIKNIWWKKEFYNSWIILNQNEIYLYFENNWVEDYLKLTK